MTDKVAALQALTPSAQWVLRGDELEWLDTVQTQPTDSAIAAKIVELQAAHDALAYARAREAAYPSIQDCIHALLDGGGTLTDLQALRTAVKAANPKGQVMTTTLRGSDNFDSGTPVTAALQKELKSGRKNLIINGGMNVKQRADSHSTEGYGSLDRYTMGLSRGSATMSQEDLTLGQSDIPTRFRHYMKLNCTTGNNNCGFYHYIENPSELEGAYVLSFYAKGTNPAAGNFALSVQSSYGTGGSTGVNPHDGTLTVTSSWQRFTVAITFPSLTGKTVNDANGTTGINVRQGGSDTGTAAWALDITGMQLELGSVATDFEHRSYGEELALCQRYGWNPAVVAGARVGLGQAVTTVVADIHVTNPVPMRASPTLTVIDITGGNVTQTNGSFVATTNIVLQSSTPNTVRFRVNGPNSTFVTGGLTMLSFDNVNDAFLDAEL